MDRLKAPRMTLLAVHLHEPRRFVHLRNPDYLTWRGESTRCSPMPSSEQRHVASSERRPLRFVGLGRLQLHHRSVVQPTDGALAREFTGYSNVRILVIGAHGNVMIALITKTDSVLALTIVDAEHAWPASFLLLRR